MNGSTRVRSAALLVVAAALAALVAIDQLSSRASDPEADAPASAAQRLVEQTAQLEQARRIASNEQAWAQAVERGEQALRDARSRSIEAPSVEVAGAKLREVLQQAMRDVGVTLDVSDAVEPMRVLDDEPLHVVGLQVQFQTRDAESLYALIDRLENMPQLASNVSRVLILGPGRSAGSGLDVSMDVRALTWIVRSQQ